MRAAHGLAATSAGAALTPLTFARRDLLPHDVAIRTLFCGVCHSDLHAIREPREAEQFPLVPGHELVGDVVEVGSAVTAFAAGDRVAIGTNVDSCRACPPCVAEMEQYCRTYPTTTYNGVDRTDGTRTLGGYSDSYVADQRFVHHLPANMDPARTAPLLCAGITTYSALRAWHVGPGMTVGIVGIGGLGHLAVKFARAMGAHVVAFTTSAAKVDDILRLGAHEVVISTDEDAMAALAWRLDFVLDTISSPHNFDRYLTTLKMEATLCSLGIPDTFAFEPLLLTFGRRRISSSGVGGTRETREMLEFCSAHNILADIELIAPAEIETAFSRLVNADVRYRFVMDLRG